MFSNHPSDNEFVSIIYKCLSQLDNKGTTKILNVQNICFGFCLFVLLRIKARALYATKQTVLFFHRTTLLPPQTGHIIFLAVLGIELRASSPFSFSLFFS
jgi:hypothetical protein